jgi:hypothetical protein
MVIFNQQGWGKQDIEEIIDKDEGRKYKFHPPFHLYPVRKPAACPIGNLSLLTRSSLWKFTSNRGGSGDEGNSLLGANPVRDLSQNGANTGFNAPCEPSG